MRFLLLAACAASSPDVQPRKVSAEQTACEPQGLTVKDYEEVEGKSRWTANCYGRIFACEADAHHANCVLDEKRSKQGDISAEALVRRFNTCHSGKRDACHTLAEDYELGTHGVPPNRFTAIELYGHSCKLGLQRDCVRAKMLEQASR